MTKSDNVMNSLPDELVLELLKNLDYKSVGRFCSCSSRIEEISQDCNVQSWFRVKDNYRTYLVKEPRNDPNRTMLLHSWNNKPAVINTDGSRCWYKEGKRHRDGDKPAMISKDVKVWCKEDKKHRDNDKPAVIFRDGSQHWFKKGKRHRDNDKPAVTYRDGTKIWYKKDEQYFPK